jgi:hypothetical protein
VEGRAQTTATVLDRRFFLFERPKETIMSVNAMKSRAEVAVMAAFAVGIGLLLLLVGTAHANVSMTVPGVATTIAGCNKLPLSQIEFCKSEVGWSRIGSAHVAIDKSASARTASEMAACRKLPLSAKYMCEDQAGYGQAVPRQTVSISQEAALTKADERYHAAVAACNERPISGVRTSACLSRAGQDARLAATDSTAMG